MKSVHLLPLLALFSIVAALTTQAQSSSRTTRHRARAPAIGHPPRSLPRSRQIPRPPRRARHRLGRHPLRPRLPHPGSRLRSPPGKPAPPGASTRPLRCSVSTLHAAHQQQPHPLLVTISGDLLVHQFDCRFHNLTPHATEAEYSAFAAKTVAFIALQLRETFPHTPIYFALGNNDSGCDDYREDPGSDFLHANAANFSAGVLSHANRSAILDEFPHLGDYTVTLPAPIRNTRLIVLQDIFESRRYTTCSGTSASDAAAQQIDWLRAQLTAARAAHAHVWIMAHIPPGIDAYSTFTSRRNVCTGQPPVMFLASDALATTLADFPDVIRLALFGHTHMDEFRTITTPDGTIPVKLVPSVTPVNGNDPAFTLAQIDPSTATLKDYTVYSASTQTGGVDAWDNKDAAWSKEYRYSTTYHLPDLSGASLQKLTTSFIDDKSGSTEASHAYQEFFFVGDPGASKGIKATKNAAAMKLVWPAYACAITHADAAAFRSCACPASLNALTHPTPDHR